MDNKRQNKKQIYVWDENLEFFTGLKNRSKLINLLIRKYRQDIESNGEPESNTSPAR